MKEITTNGKTLLFVEVPKDAILFEIEDDELLFFTYLYTDIPYFIDIPNGNYQILGKSTELSEEQMNEMCDTANLYTLGFPITSEKVYKDYFKTNSSFSTVQESYLSLLEANGIDNNKHYLVLEKI